MRTFLALLAHELKLLWANKLLILIFGGGPLLYSTLIGFVYKDATVYELPIMVVDLDYTPLSGKVIDALDDNQYLQIAKVEYSLNHERAEMVDNKIHAVITIPDRFEADIQQKRHPEVDVDVNASNMLTANYVSTGIQTVLATLNAGIEIESIKKKGTPDAIAQQQFESFKISTSRFFNPSSNYLLFLYPGMLGTIMQQVFLLVLALAFAGEFENKTYGDLLSITKSPIVQILTKALFYSILGLMLWLPLIHISFAAFHISMMKSIFTFWFMSFVFMLSLSFAGLAASVVLGNSLRATEVLMIVAAPSFIVSGQTWPLLQMPHAVQIFASTIPLTHYLEAFRRLLLMDASFTEVKPQLFNLLTIAVVCFLVSWSMLWWKQRRITD